MFWYHAKHEWTKETTTQSRLALDLGCKLSIEFSAIRLRWPLMNLKAKNWMQVMVLILLDKRIILVLNTIMFWFCLIGGFALRVWFFLNMDFCNLKILSSLLQTASTPMWQPFLSLLSCSLSVEAMWRTLLGVLLNVVYSVFPPFPRICWSLPQVGINLWCDVTIWIVKTIQTLTVTFKISFPLMSLRYIML